VAVGVGWAITVAWTAATMVAWGSEGGVELSPQAARLTDSSNIPITNEIFLFIKNILSLSFLSTCDK
jgi:hypothetical protein